MRAGGQRRSSDEQMAEGRVRAELLRYARCVRFLALVTVQLDSEFVRDHCASVGHFAAHLHRRVCYLAFVLLHHDADSKRCSTEASGTSNMKFSMNGGIIIGTVGKFLVFFSNLQFTGMFR